MFVLARFRMVVRTVGRPPGLYSADTDFRQDKDCVRRVNGWDRELVPARPGNRVLTVCDRENDFRETHSCVQETVAAWPVPVGHGRRMALVSGEEAILWDHVLETGPVGGGRPACGDRRHNRTAALRLRCTPPLLPKTR